MAVMSKLAGRRALLATAAVTPFLGPTRWPSNFLMVSVKVAGGAWVGIPAHLTILYGDEALSSFVMRNRVPLSVYREGVELKAYDPIPNSLGWVEGNRWLANRILSDYTLRVGDLIIPTKELIRSTLIVTGLGTIML